ncbi:hypothetical protein ABT168_06970 [Streptomyces sp. NPDC001793]|uniref:hypothetical protein n=1 Tax=Streptomyces sp. NPDC001793 TaxID=3154657 RepID=UPI00331EFD27
MFNFHPSRIAAAAVLAALPAVGLAVTAAPAHADAPNPVQQPKDGHDDDSMGGIDGMGAVGNGLLDHDRGGQGDDKGGKGGHGSMMGGPKGGQGSRGSMMDGLG